MFWNYGIWGNRVLLPSAGQVWVLHDYGMGVTWLKIEHLRIRRGKEQKPKYIELQWKKMTEKNNHRNHKK